MLKKLEYVKDNEDGTKQYKNSIRCKNRLKKNTIWYSTKEDITIFELKKAEVSLEDAFMKLIDDRQENINKNEEEMIIDKSEEENANKADNEQQTDKIENNVEESIETTNSDNDTTTKQEKGGKE